MKGLRVDTCLTVTKNPPSLKLISETAGIYMHNTLRRLGLNLLVTLDAPLSEQNVTRAARLLNLAQPTVSLQLGH